MIPSLPIVPTLPLCGSLYPSETATDLSAFPDWISPHAAVQWLPHATAPVGSTAWINQLEAFWLGLPEMECPIVHRLADGVYVREMLMPANNVVIGHEHIHAHHNVLLTGRASVLVEGEFHRLHAGSVFTCTAGVRKVIVSHEDLRWATFHATTETSLDNLDRIEAALFRKSPAWIAYHESLNKTATGETQGK